MVARGMDLLRLAILILFAAPGFAAHTGVTRRNGFSLSDAAIFGIVVGGLWLAQRAMRRRHRKPDDRRED